MDGKIGESLSTSVRASPPAPSPANYWWQARCASSKLDPVCNSTIAVGKKLEGVPSEWHLFTVDAEGRETE